MLLNTVLLMIVRRANKGVKKTTIQVKTILVAILAFLGYKAYVLIGGETPARFVVEYSFVTVAMAYYWTMGNNYKKFIIDYELTA